jgi:hypothetical protein
MQNQIFTLKFNTFIVENWEKPEMKLDSEPSFHKQWFYAEILLRTSVIILEI